jgi:hypothetical protein
MFTANYVPAASPLTVEAEHFVGNIGRSAHSWLQKTDKPGFAGASFMRNDPDNGSNITANITTTAPELQYTFQFPSAGIYHVWLRAQTANLANDSVHIGLDGVVSPTADKVSCTTYNVWYWCNATMDGPVATINVPSAGAHTVSVYQREDGFRVDRLLLTPDSSYVPTGQGPPENLGGGPAPNPVPTITSLNPASAVAGGAGFTLTVNGVGFLPDSVVRWAGSPKTTTYVGPDRVTIPVSAADIAAQGSVAVTVTNPAPGGGTSAPMMFAIDAPTNPVPTTSGTNPSSVVAGTPGVTLTVSGSGFLPSSTVRWNGAARTTTYVSPTSLTATIPASDLASPGTGTVTVVNPSPGGGVSNAQSVSITPASSGVLLSENFDGMTTGAFPPGWTSHTNGIWAVVVDGLTKVVEQSKVTTANLQLTTGSTAWTDYSVKADMKAPTGPAFFGLVGRHQDPNNTYMFVLKNGNQWQLGKRVGGTFSQLALGTFVYTPGSWYTLELSMVGSTIVAKINGTTVRTVTDTALTSGNVGFRTNALVRYDNLVVSLP